jgi:predicted RNA binding protein YcfA (HicA-like mRNA interferase family)
LSQYGRDADRLAKLGLEAYATYQPIHFFGTGKSFATNWGIYIAEQGVLRLAAALRSAFTSDSRFGEPSAPSNHLFIEMAYQVLLRHELGHFKIESFALNAEMFTGRALYVPYLVGVYAEVYDGVECLEEAVANAMVLNSQKIDAIFKVIYPTRAGEKETWRWRLAVSSIFNTHPECYANYDLRKGPHQQLDDHHGLLGDRQRATNYLCNQILTGEQHPNIDVPFYAYPPDNYFLRAENLVPIHVVKSLDPKDWFLLGAPPKKKDWERFLRALGFKEYPSQGKGSHSKWKRSDFAGSLNVPHRNELSIGVFKQSLRDLDIKESDFRQFMHTKQLPPQFRRGYGTA